MTMPTSPRAITRNTKGLKMAAANFLDELEKKNEISNAATEIGGAPPLMIPRIKRNRKTGRKNMK